MAVAGPGLAHLPPLTFDADFVCEDLCANMLLRTFATGCGGQVLAAVGDGKGAWVWRQPGDTTERAAEGVWNGGRENGRVVRVSFDQDIFLLGSAHLMAFDMSSKASATLPGPSDCGQAVTSMHM